MSKYVLYLLVCCCTYFTTSAQVDPHFSQFYAHPLWLNPGMAGVMDGGYRITSVYRNQWSSVMPPYSTAGLSADFVTNKNLNLGVSFMNQSAGDAGYKYLTASATIAYSGIRFGQDKNQQLTMGMQFGLLSRRFDPTKFQFGDQWNAVTGYDPGVVSADLITKTSSSVFDMGAGISYADGSPDKKINLFGGVAAFHLNKPADPFVNTESNDFLPARYTVQLGGRASLTDRLSITPNVLYMQQGSSREIIGGLFAQYNVNESAELYFGANYRSQDAISPYVGVGFRHFVVGISYDVTTSNLGKAVPGANALELSLSYTHPKTGKSLRYLSCPKF